MSVQRVQVVDSHTGGEPTRIVVAGAPDLGGGTVADRLHVFRTQHDPFRSAVVNEPRGSDVLVGALLVEPADPSCTVGVIFFNNAGTLGMCGHGTIGLMVTLAHLGRIGPGMHRIETPVGVVTAWLHADGYVAVQNVPAYRHLTGVRVPVPGHKDVTGDVAWGGNWFFLCEDHGQVLSFSNVEVLTEFTWRIRQSLDRHGITGRDGRQVDHIELFAPSPTPGLHSRNFVLCPGKAYDRSPCGTGTSAKLACLYAAGKLRAGEVWRQESIIGSVFEGSVEINSDLVLPTIRGNAYINSEATLILDSTDPFCYGIRS